ncbi:MAG: SH3 domain-containing protein [Clostridia bacterium]|nr:SH3 domain-containing protein [Clostridia bacterium]
MKYMRIIRMMLLAGMLLVMMAVAACGEAYTVDAPELNEEYRCVDYSGELPEAIAGVFDGLMRDGDRIIAGNWAAQHWKAAAEHEYESVLMAVERENSVLIMCASKDDGIWNAGVETDSFIPKDKAFTLTFLPEESGEGWRIDAGHAIVCDDGIYRIRIPYGCRPEILSVERRQTDGRRLIMDFLYCTLGAYTLDEDVYEEQIHAHCSLPSRLAGWRMEDIPKDVGQMKQYAETHQLALGEGQAFICGVNLREQPTSKSQTHGLYSARVNVLESRPGIAAPWYHVRVGDTEGWVSGDYLLDGSAYDVRYYSMGAENVKPARVRQETALVSKPDGEAKTTLQAGTILHVIAEKDGWLHVVVQENASPFADWDGDYGYVRETDVARGRTLTELKWTE